MMASGGAISDPTDDPLDDPTDRGESDTFGAFCTHHRVRIAGASGGPLGGLTFAAKDLFEVAGLVACCGNPAWHATHAPAKRTASAIAALLDAGATLVGMTVTDELALSLTGENVHYGTPVNPRCPDRVPGGSSSGSAVAVAAGLADLALGTDTGGSVRVPASHCGLYGFRPTHGAVPTYGVWPLAPRFDTVGWMARDPITLARAGDILLPPPWPDGDHPLPARLLASEAANALLDPEARPVFAAAAETVSLRLGRVLANARLSPVGWLEAYLTLQNGEAAALHRPWLTRHGSALGSLIGGRFARALAVTADDVDRAEEPAAAIAFDVWDLLRDDAWLIWPSAAGGPPPRGLSDRELDAITGRSLTLGALASLAGLPQLSIPVGEVAGFPFGVSLIGPRGSDRALLAAAVAFAKEDPS